MLSTRDWSWTIALAVSLAACGGQDAERVFPPLDQRDAGSQQDAAEDASDDASADDDGGSETVECETAADCPVPTEPCVLAICVAGACRTAHAPAGAEIPEAMQIVGDCKRLECGEDGELVAKVDTGDTPPEEDCVRNYCDGPNPRSENLAPGTPCSGNGFCNGAGQCGSCTPGAKGCSGNVPQVCDEHGKWQAGEACPNKCKAGVCED